MTERLRIPSPLKALRVAYNAFDQIVMVTVLLTLLGLQRILIWLGVLRFYFIVIYWWRGYRFKKKR